MKCQNEDHVGFCIDVFSSWKNGCLRITGHECRATSSSLLRVNTGSGLAPRTTCCKCTPGLITGYVEQILLQVCVHHPCVLHLDIGVDGESDILIFMLGRH